MCCQVGVDRPCPVHDHSPAEMRQLLRGQSAFGILKVGKAGEKEQRYNVSTITLEDGAKYNVELFGSAIRERSFYICKLRLQACNCISLITPCLRPCL